MTVASSSTSVRNGRRITVTTRRPSVWRSWHVFAAYVYLFICLFDFVLMPAFYEFAHKVASDQVVIAEALKFAPDAQVTVLQMLRQSAKWTPLTLGENGLFHVSFGAILGVSAFARGNERTARVKNGMPDDDSVEVTRDEPAPKPTPKPIQNDDDDSCAPPDAAGNQDDHETEA
jgi:hypothetical protein